MAEVKNIDKKEIKDKFIALGKTIKAWFDTEETPEEKTEREAKEAADKLKLEAKTKGFKSEKFAEAKLKDGRMISYDGETPATGMLVNISDAEGNYTPCPDGDYELEDGSMIVVKDATIIDVKKAAEPSEEEEMSALEKKIGKLQIAQEVEKHKAAIAELKEKAKQYEKMTTELASQKQALKDIFELVEKIADLEGEESATTKKDKFSKPVNGLAEARKLFKEINKRNKN